MGALVAIAIPFWPEERPSGVTAAAWSGWLAAFAAFFSLFWLSLARPRLRPPWRFALLAGETATVLALLSLRPALGIEGALFVPVAFQLGRERSAPISLLWIALQSAAMLAILNDRGASDSSTRSACSPPIFRFSCSPSSPRRCSATRNAPASRSHGSMPS